MATPLEELIAAAASDDAPVSTLLRKLKVVAARLGTVSLEEWVDHELQGYPDDAPLPDYRAERGSEIKGHFGGAFGSGMRNAPIPPVSFPDDMKHLFQISYRQSVAELERLAAATEALSSGWAADMVALTNRRIQRGEIHLYEGMYLQEAWHYISPANIGGIVDTVRTRVLDLALSLEAIEPRAGEPATPAEDLARVEQLVVNVFGGNVAVASTEVRQQAVTVATGDRGQLRSVLGALGVSADDVADLEKAIDDDERHGDGAPGQGHRPTREGVDR